LCVHLSMILLTNVMEITQLYYIMTCKIYFLNIVVKGIIRKLLCCSVGQFVLCMLNAETVKSALVRYECILRSNMSVALNSHDKQECICLPYTTYFVLFYVVFLLTLPFIASKHFFCYGFGFSFILNIS